MQNRILDVVLPDDCILLPTAVQTVRMYVLPREPLRRRDLYRMLGRRPRTPDLDFLWHYGRDREAERQAKNWLLRQLAYPDDGANLRANARDIRSGEDSAVCVKFWRMDAGLRAVETGILDERVGSSLRPRCVFYLRMSDLSIAMNGGTIPSPGASRGEATTPEPQARKRRRGRRKDEDAEGRRIEDTFSEMLDEGIVSFKHGGMSAAVAEVIRRTGTDLSDSAIRKRIQPLRDDARRRSRGV